MIAIAAEDKLYTPGFRISSGWISTTPSAVAPGERSFWGISAFRTVTWAGLIGLELGNRLVGNLLVLHRGQQIRVFVGAISKTVGERTRYGSALLLVTAK